MEPMNTTISSNRETKAFQIAVPLTDKEKSLLDQIKRTTGRTIGHYVREAILEKLHRDHAKKKIVPIFPGIER